MKNIKRILYIVEDIKSPQFRYRVKNIVEVADNSRQVEVKWVLRSEIQKINLKNLDLIVILRQTAKDRKILDFIELARKHGVKVLFDLDDLVFEYRDLLILMKTTNSRNVFYWMGYVWGIRRIAKRVDGFICTNGFLAKKLRQSFRRPIKVIRNSLNKCQINISEKYLLGKKHNKFIIGYFSGSPTHAKDFRLIEPELIKFLKDHDDARLRVVGYMEFSSAMKRLIEEDKVETVDLTGYLKLQKLIAEVDVNIAPLVVNDFTNCKSELKFFEAAVVETTTIASPTYAFKNAIKDRGNGFLAQPGEWYDKLEYLYKHPEENRRIARNAKNFALEHYYGKNFLEEVERTYDYFSK